MLLPLTLALVISCSVLAFDHPRMEFEKFKLMHGKTYASLEEEETRFGHFMNNLEKIEQHNSEGHSWRMGVTKFADLSKYSVYILHIYKSEPKLLYLVSYKFSSLYYFNVTVS